MLSPGMAALPASNHLEATGEPPFWTPARRLAAGFFVLYLAVQVLLPLALLLRPRPARFGWQMYSAVPAEWRLVVERRDGHRTEVDARAYTAFFRGDSDSHALVLQEICGADPAVAAVHVKRVGAAEIATEHRCR